MTGLLATAGWQVWGKAAGGSGSGQVPRAFSPWQMATLERACAASLEDADAAVVTARELDAHFATTGAEVAPDFALALAVMEFGHAGRRFSRLSLDEAAETLDAWARSKVGVRRQIAKALRDAARFTWFGREETWAALDYDGPWIR
ncbi:MAG: hypothetical protein KDA24_11800 [Deltaproteobacteria bacterium]|nr:hypothetical protein [Deltaproteobacteria bacterium]